MYIRFPRAGRGKGCPTMKRDGDANGIRERRRYSAIRFGDTLGRLDAILRQPRVIKPRPYQEVQQGGEEGEYPSGDEWKTGALGAKLSRVAVGMRGGWDGG